MASLIPISTYNLALKPFNPVPAVDEDFPVTVRLTLAAVDPESVDDKNEPSTVRILRKVRDFDQEFDYDEEDDEEDDEDDEEDELDEEEVKNTKKAKNGKKAKVEEEDEEEEDEEDEDDEEDDDEDDEDIEEFILCTLSPKVQFQQTLDFTISPSEEIHFVVTGSYPVHLTGNYVEHPADSESDDYDSDSDEYDSDEYNLTPDEDELVDIADLEDESDIEAKIEELVEEEEQKKSKKRASEAKEVKESKKAKTEQPTKAEKAAESSKAKKEKKEKKDKKVQFTKELEQGPTPAEPKKDDKPKDKKFPTKTLLGGVITEDRKTGSGSGAKSGNKVGIRYIGKLKNGKVFDKNTSGKPFTFNLGKGECIKGFDLGVAGMAVGGERRVVIPAKMGYGSQALPGIPANSELTFDIKLVSLK